VLPVSLVKAGLTLMLLAREYRMARSTMPTARTPHFCAKGADAGGARRAGVLLVAILFCNSNDTDEIEVYGNGQVSASLIRTMGRAKERNFSDDLLFTNLTRCLRAWCILVL
jgi:hypothetical protein